MAHSLSAKKRIRQNAKHAARNRWRMRSMKGVIKDLVDKLAHGSTEEVTKAHSAFVQSVDRTAGKGVIHKNQAARRKSRMSRRVKAKLGTAPGGAAPVAAAKPGSGKSGSGKSGAAKSGSGKSGSGKSGAGKK